MKRHLERHVRPQHFFSREEKLRIAGAISEAEGRTAGEIRVHVESESGGNPVQRAQQIFGALGMTRTAARNGVLIYLAVRERKFAIIGDEGIDRVVPPGFWETTKDAMAEHFRAGRFVEGVIHGIESAGAHLAAYFPRAVDDVNELTDEISEGK